MTSFSLVFWSFLALCASVTYRSSDHYKKRHAGVGGGGGNDTDNELSEDHKAAHTKLLKKYLFVYLMATLSDWLQGPYVYALYSEYGFDQHRIAELFVAGFGSSMVFGSFVGGIADLKGRRLFVILFAVVYLASCLTKREFRGFFFFPRDVRIFCIRIGFASKQNRPRTTGSYGGYRSPNAIDELAWNVPWNVFVSRFLLSVFLLSIAFRR